MAQAKRIAERNDIDPAAITADADNFACGDGNRRCGEADRHVLKVHRGGRGLRGCTETREPFLTAFDHGSSADADEVRSEEAGGFLRGLCMEPLVFYAEDGLRRTVVWRRLRGCPQKRRDCEQSGNEKLPSQILMKIFLR